MAFSITRGAAQIKIEWLTDGLIGPCMILAVESFSLFAIARLAA